MKIWITKYAMTKGVYEADADQVGISMVRVKGTLNSYTQYFHGEGREWHRNKEQAKERAEVMRDMKIASLEKSIKKIRALNF